MTHKKNGFLTFCFSCLPGAGQCYLGFSKLGVSLLTAFFGVVTLSAFLRVDAFVFVLPIIWVYAFFDAINRNSLPDEQFAMLEDHYLFVDSAKDFKNFPLKKYKTIIAIVLILIGADLLLQNSLNMLGAMGITFGYEVEHAVLSTLPSIVVSIVIILAGLYLIRGKKQSLDDEEDLDFPEITDKKEED